MAGASSAGGSRRRGRSPTPPGSPGSDQDLPDILDSHPFLQFPLRTDAHRRLGRLISRPIEVPRAIDWDVLRLLGEYQRAVTIIGVDTSWRRFFDGGFLSAYLEITYEFFCTCRFLHPQTSGPRQHPGQIQFRLCGELHRMTLPEFGVLLGLYTEEEIDTDLYRKRPGGYIYVGGYVTHLAQRLGVFDADVEASMTARYRPERVGRATLSAIRIAADFRGLGFRFCLEQGVPWVPQQQQHGEVRAAPAGAPLLPPPPPRGRRLVFRDPILRDQSRRLDRLEDLAAWQSEVLIAVATHLGVQIPALPPPRHSIRPYRVYTDVYVGLGVWLEGVFVWITVALIINSNRSITVPERGTNLICGFTNLENSFQIPSPILNTLCLFGFVEEFFLFYIQKKDPDGIENRYYDLLLVPICVCIVSTVLELRSQKSNYSRLGRGIGLVLQGMWFVQMGFSFYSELITDGCFMREKSRGNFTIRCKGHPEFHRARSIATLQFNCHLALLVCLIAGVYSLVSRKHGVSNESMQYKPLGAEMQHLDRAQFTLDSDDDEDVDGNDHDGVRDEGSMTVEKNLVVASETGVNGYGSHH
ncbi:hypothetical protein E3N88_30263 [Mikania micrantha]|uniref:Uncharacterized protein n=1 Tax=Mikania micrantha TaxID=192012 RepID=A0A5N6MLA6_9ASTR|nr:hypothetical protein E3N88_30263 [Mikania micrantha]